jgi:hypothetical protein
MQGWSLRMQAILLEHQAYRKHNSKHNRFRYAHMIALSVIYPVFTLERVFAPCKQGKQAQVLTAMQHEIPFTKFLASAHLRQNDSANGSQFGDIHATSKRFTCPIGFRPLGCNGRQRMR